MKLNLEYIKNNCFLNKVDSRLKIIYIAFIINFIFLIKNYNNYIIITLFTLFLIKISKITLKQILKTLKPVMSLAIFTLILNLILPILSNNKNFNIQKDVKFEFITYFISFIRMSILLTNVNILTYTTSVVEITNGLEKLLYPLKYLKFPLTEFTIIISISMRFIPTMFREIEKISMAQRSRGAKINDKNIIKKAKAISSILIPLFINSFARTEELAIAMESRCFDPEKKRTKYKKIKFKKHDYFVMALMILFFIALTFIETTKIKIFI